MSEETVVLFPTNEITEVVEPEIDRDEISLKLDILLERLQALLKDIKRRVDNLPRDLHFELCELLREPRP